MDKIKSFLKKDSDILRNSILFLFGISLGTYKLFFQHTHRTNSVIIGSILLIASISLLIPIKKQKKN